MTSNLKVGLLASALLGLIVMNIMTLASKTAHDFSYGILEGVAAFAIVQSVAELMSSRPLLENSPKNVSEAAMKTATEKLMGEKAHLANLATNLAAKTQDLIKVHEELSAKHIALNKSYRNLANVSANLAAKTQDLVKVYGELDAKHVEMKRVVVRNRAVTAKVSRQIAARAAKGTVRSISSMVGKAVPFAGVALMVAMTGLDVKDACDSLRDLNEMNVTIGAEMEEEGKVCGVRVPTKDAVIEEVKRVKSTNLGSF